MAFHTPVSLNYGTHLPALMRAFERTSGPVLELGMGLFSTPYLHYACLLAKRPLISYEPDLTWASRFEPYLGEYHSLAVGTVWNEWAIHWSLVLVDHTDEHRAPDIAALADSADYIIAHDANGRFDSRYHYSTIYPLFKYRAMWTGDSRHAAVLSNFVDLGDFWG